MTTGSALAGDYPLWPPPVESLALRLLTPRVLEASFFGDGLKDPRWDLMNPEAGTGLPWPGDFEVSTSSRSIGVSRVGFKRRAWYAPISKKDIRVGNHLYLLLDSPVPQGEKVTVANVSGLLWPRNVPLCVRADPLRFSQAIHVNQLGYGADWPKLAVVGMWLGSLGELDPSTDRTFQVVDDATGRVAYSGRLSRRLDSGFSDLPYTKVFEADFSSLTASGRYRIKIPGLGASYPFVIGPQAPAALARAYALGFYHQRSGAAIGPPFTRHSHGPSHVAPATVPELDMEKAQKMIRGNADDNKIAPRMTTSEASLFPFIRRGQVDVSGGHHDAGDYSKYTINSAQLIHALMFAVDAMPGVAGLDNLGLPESGDGIPDVLQVAKWEADFLAKMQDTDGGFYVLVYPAERSYEIDVTPDNGDPQIVFPKNTAATAAAVAALAQAAGSPAMKRHYPEAARTYLAKAQEGWRFLEKGWARFTRAGAYQSLHHYGSFFKDEDEIAWAATELFLTTADPDYHRFLLQVYDPTDRETRLWTWWRMFEGYGAAARSYAFAPQAGRIPESGLNADHLAGCRAEVIDTGYQMVDYTEACSYNTSFPKQSKRHRRAGWYFPLVSAFELAAAHILEPQAEFMSALTGNVAFEGGVNPNNMCLLTGFGYSSPREIVNQFAKNDRRRLPPAGLAVGGISEGFAKVPAGLYPKLDAATYPPEKQWPFYDRWADTFNLAGEPTVVSASKGLAVAAWLMASTSLAVQPWQAVQASIVVPPRIRAGEPVTLRLNAPGFDAARARIIWEREGAEPLLARELTFTPAGPGGLWVEVEAALPDGRRVFAQADLEVQ